MEIFDNSKHRLILWDKVTGLQFGVNIIPAEKDSIEIIRLILDAIRLKEKELIKK